MGKLKQTHFDLQKSTEPQKQASYCTGNLHRFLWNIGCSGYCERPNFLDRDLGGEGIAKKSEKAI